MRLAVLADIHGNLHALEAALKHISTQNVDQIVVAGDIVNVMPDSKACWDLVTSLSCPVLRGNHERYLFDYGTSQADPSWSTDRFQPIKYALNQFSKGDLDVMRRLPMTHRFENLLIVHSSPHSDQGNVVAETPDEVLDEMFSGTTEAFLVRGHNHKWLERRWSGRQLISMASLGLPLNGCRDAQYLILEHQGAWQWKRNYVPYDVDAALERFDATDYFDLGGPMVRLFYRELLTAQNHLIPFLNAYLPALDDAKLSLDEAVSSFLAN